MHYDKKDQNEYLDELWRQHRKTIEYPETALEANQLSYEASLMQDWFMDNHKDLYTLTYARGLKLTRHDIRAHKGEARYLAKIEAKDNLTQEA